MLFARDVIGFCVQTTPAHWYRLLHAREPYPTQSMRNMDPSFMLCSCGASTLFENDCTRTVLCVVSQSDEHLSLWI